MSPADIPIRGLHLPPEPGLWPLAPGWWALIVLTAILLSVLLYKGIRSYRANRARRFALRQVEQACTEYATHGNPVMLCTTLSDLLRRTMLAYAPRADVAGLSGTEWANWLDRGLATPLFTEGAGRHLMVLPYQRPTATADDIDIRAVVAAVRQRIRTPLGDAA